jgi:hypothetical protein
MFVRKIPSMVLAIIICGCPLARGDDKVSLNQEYKGTTSDKLNSGKFAPKFVYDSAPIELKSGQKLDVSVKALGDSRQVAIGVFNSDGQALALSWPCKQVVGIGGQSHPLTKTSIGGFYPIQPNLKTARLTVNEMPTTGTYTIIVYSNIEGDYTLLAKDSAKKRDFATVEKELKAARQRVEDLEKEQKAFESKKNDK